MPSLTEEFLKKLKSDYHQYPTFIETGTYVGSTTFNMESCFNHIYTIEINESLHQNVKNRYTGQKIQFLLGDSSIVFKDLLPTIEEDSIFFLDGHWSSGNTGRGSKDCPLIEEIICINFLFKKNAIIIIDDVRLFGKGPNLGNLVENWEDISKDKILDVLKDRITDVYTLDSECSPSDRLIIHIKQF